MPWRWKAWGAPGAQAWCCWGRLNCGCPALLQTARPRTRPARRRALRVDRAGSAKAEARSPPRSRVRRLPPGLARSPASASARAGGSGVSGLDTRVLSPASPGASPFLPAFSTLSPRPTAHFGQCVTSGNWNESFRGQSCSPRGLGGEEKPEAKRTGACDVQSPPLRRPRAVHPRVLLPGLAPAARRSELAVVTPWVPDWAGRRRSPRGA